MTNAAELRPGISAVIITYNEAGHIAACIDSVAFCDEVLVVDAHSTDATRDIAARLGARVIERDWPGYRSQKEFAVAAAAHDWVLCVDADERVVDSATDEKTKILAALEWAEGNRARAARKLGLSRATFYRRLEEFGIPRKRS